MYGSQPETQMLQLWSNHRRRTAYTVKPVTDRTHAIHLRGAVRRTIFWAVLLGGLMLLLTGCVAHYPAYGYSSGYSRGYGHHNHGHSPYYGGYRGRDRHGYRRRHHNDD
jgi:hypothetical protein